MPRKTRIVRRDNLYHVINRGNYRSDIFGTDESKASFEKTIFETCEKAGWRLYREMLLEEESHDEISFKEQRKRMTRGWCIGSMKYKQNLAKQLEATQPRGEQRTEDLRDLNILKWGDSGSMFKGVE